MTMRTQHGFSLIELLVAAAVFTFVVTSVTGLFATALNLQRRATGIQKIEENAQFALESIAREVRVSTVTSGDTSCTPIDPVATGDGGNYRVVVTGNGPGTAANVLLSDVLPAGLVWTVNPDRIYGTWPGPKQRGKPGSAQHAASCSVEKLAASLPAEAWHPLKLRDERGEAVLGDLVPRDPLRVALPRLVGERGQHLVDGRLRLREVLRLVDERLDLAVLLRSGRRRRCATPRRRSPARRTCPHTGCSGP